jgi:dCTP deaminase
MILSDGHILQALASGHLQITPPPEDRQIQPNSLDLRLGSTFLVPRRRLYELDGRREEQAIRETVTVPDGGRFLLAPGAHVNAATLEYVEMPPTLCGKVEGKSTFARLGLQIEAAGWVGSGFHGHLTLELHNFGESMLVLRPGISICQLVLFRTDRPSRLYGDAELGSRYQDSRGPQAAVLGSAAASTPHTPRSDPSEPDSHHS